MTKMKVVSNYIIIAVLLIYLWCRDTWHPINLCISISCKIEPLMLNFVSIDSFKDVLDVLLNMLSDVILNYDLTFTVFILYNALKLFLLFTLLTHIFLLRSKQTAPSPFGACAVNLTSAGASVQYATSFKVKYNSIHNRFAFIELYLTLIGSNNLILRYKLLPHYRENSRHNRFAFLVFSLSFGRKTSFLGIIISYLHDCLFYLGSNANDKACLHFLPR